MIVDEELRRRGSARPSLGYLVQAVLHHADDDVKRRFLPGLINGKIDGAKGSASPTRGPTWPRCGRGPVRDSDEYVITGHKVWTSYSDLADWCFLLVRTDPDDRKHKGAVDLRRPDGPARGRAAAAPDDQQDHARVRRGDLRRGARRPNMIGEPGEGWRIAMTVLNPEREPQELGNASRYTKTVGNSWTWRGRRATSTTSTGALGGAIVEAEMLQPPREPAAVGTPRRHRPAVPRARSTSCS